MESFRAPSAAHLVGAARGFTLVEMLVVIAIVMVVMAVVFSTQTSFNRSYLLANTAYDVSLTLRDAQTFGLGSRAIGSTFNAGYGLRFDRFTPNSFIFFADVSPAAACTMPNCRPGNYVYTSGQDTLVRTYTLGNGVTISNMCAYTRFWRCVNSRSGAFTGLQTLDVVFARPNPDPYMSENSSYQPSQPVTRACLILTSAAGGSRYVSVSVSGEITANAVSCP